MNKKFIKSMVAAVASLSIISSCSMLSGKDSHASGGKNNCKGKAMEDSHKCAASKDEAKKVESNNCGAKNGCAAAKADVAKTSKAKKSTAKKN